MKKIILAGFSILIGLQLFAYPHVSAFPTPVISEKLLQTFRESFPNAEKIVWNESRDQYTVSFLETGILNRITYDKNGGFSGSIRYYTARYLPYYLVSLLKDKYPRQKIFGVTEITAPAGILYYVKMEDPKYWYTVVLDGEGHSEVQDKYRKAP
jgi:hypothetical protein